MNKYYFSFTDEQIKIIEKYNREGKAIDWKGFSGKDSEIKLK